MVMNNCAQLPNQQCGKVPDICISTAQCQCHQEQKLEISEPEKLSLSTHFLLTTYSFLSQDKVPLCCPGCPVIRSVDQQRSWTATWRLVECRSQKSFEET